MKNIVIIALCLVLVSCGAKKTNTLKSESDTKTEATTTDQTNIVAAVTTQQETTGETCTDSYEPANPAEPMVIDDGKGNKTTIYNGKKTTTKSREASKTNTQAKTTTTMAKAAVVKTEAKAALQTSATDRKASFAGFYTVGGSIIGLGIVGWFIWFFYLRKNNTNEADKN